MTSHNETSAERPPLRFAVIGAGVIGPVHAHVVASIPDAQLVAVVDVVEDRARELAQEFGAEWSTDLDAVLARDDIDAVTIATPSGMHADHAIAALRAGKHVIVEKPVDVSLEAAERLIAAEEASGKTVAVVSQHRFDHSTEKVLDAVRSGRLGTITSVIASHAWWRSQEYYDSGDWRGTWALDGGGATMNQTVHTINLLCAVGGVPTEVFGYTATLAHERIEVEDTAVAVVRFESGALGMIHATTSAAPGLDARLSVYGSRGSAIISDDALVYIHQANPDDDQASSDPLADGIADNQVTEADQLSDEDRRFGSAHRRQFLDFVDAVRTGRPPRVTTADARQTLAVILALYESARTGRPVSPQQPGSGTGRKDA